MVENAYFCIRLSLTFTQAQTDKTDLLNKFGCGEYYKIHGILQKPPNSTKLIGSVRLQS